MALNCAQCPTWSRFRILKLSQTTKINVLYFPNDITFGSHSWNESERWNAPHVCHCLWSTLWSHVQVCWLTIEYLVYQCVPNTSILGQSESIRPTILPRISILFKTMSRYFVQLLSCFVRHFTKAFHTLFWHDLPCRRTKWKSPMFPRLVVFPDAFVENCGFKHGSVIVKNILSHVALSLSAPKCTWSRNDVGSPKSTSL